MGKINKKSKPLLSPKGRKEAATTAETPAARNKLDKFKSKVDKEDKTTLLLHKTITPKKITSKKDKFRQKHKNLMNKFALIKKQRKEENARKNREKTAVIGDLKPLKDALPSLDELFMLSKKGGTKTGVKEFDEEPKKLNVTQKIKKKKNKFISQVNAYQALLRDPEFKKNPRDLISYHIKYTNGLIED